MNGGGTLLQTQSRHAFGDGPTRHQDNFALVIHQRRDLCCPLFDDVVIEASSISRQ